GAARLDRVVRQGVDQAQPPSGPQPADPEAGDPLHVQGRGAAARPGPPYRQRRRRRVPGTLVLSARPVLALTQGDPAGIGPEILLKLLAAGGGERPWQPLLVAERAAVEALVPILPGVPWDRLTWLSGLPGPGDLARRAAAGAILAVDPVGAARTVAF